MKESWGMALTQEMKNEWFTTEEVAEYFKIGVSTVEQLRIKGGGVPFTKFGKKTIRYHIDDMRQYGKKFAHTAEYQRAA